MKRHFSMFAAYNSWANAELYAQTAELTDEEFGRDTGVFFKTMRGTLNHILVGDRIWMHRFTGEGDNPKDLDAIIFEKFKPLRIARESEDRRIVNWIEQMDDEAFIGRFTYMPITTMRIVSQRLGPALTHFFNHQTHHRGQAHAILSILGYSPPSLDMIYFQRTASGQKWA